MSLNVSCSVCKSVFKKPDAVYSTNCGHTFHYRCIIQWKGRSTSCPVCRTYNFQTMPLYLNFEDGIDYETVVKDLKAKLTTYESKNITNQEKIFKQAKKIDDVKRLYNISEQWRAELEDKIKTLNQQNQQQNEKHLHALSNKTEEIEMHKKHIEIFEKDDVVKNLSANYEQIISENLKLKKNLQDSETLRLMLNQKLELQEQRLTQMSLELEKQFTDSFKQLNKPSESGFLGRNSAMKQRIRRRGQRNKSNENGKLEEATKVPVTENPVAFAPSAPEISEVFAPILPLTKCHTNMEQASKTMFKKKENKCFRLAQSTDCRLLIIDYPTENVEYPIMYTVWLLATKMGINLKLEDILEAHILNSKNRYLQTTNNKVNIIAELKNIEIKIQFLKSAKRLKSYAEFQSVKLKEYMDEHVYTVFMYANRKLRGKVYEYIASKDNKVIAKKKLTDTEEIVIRDRDHVDEIFQSQNITPINTMHRDFDRTIDPVNNCFLG